ncbi:MAG TPA: alpha/beta fold hydrolase [Planctomycetaceae bacterium]|nr:alpha/beta fold hydrolase [Planctomycetaceae bacterium]
MTHFTAAGSRTGSPEALSFLQKCRVGLLGVSLPKPVNSVDPTQFGLSFETLRFGGESRSELEGWFIPHAKPKGVVLFAHGYAACKSSLLKEASAVHALGYSVFLFDCHGSGGSEGRVTSIGVREADDVADAFAFAQERFGTSPIVLFGQSMGSAAILRAIAIQGIEPAGVIVECPFDRLLSTAENRFRAMKLPAFPAARLLIFWGGLQLGFNGFQHNPVDYATQVQCPVLFLQGAKDPRVTLEQAQAVFDNLAGRKTFVVFPSAGHESLLTADSELWTKSVGHFLENIRRPDIRRSDTHGAAAPNFHQP